MGHESNEGWLDPRGDFVCDSVGGKLSEGRSRTIRFSTRTLKNGMKVLVQMDHSIPNVALYIFYRIGSRNERPGTTGLSHFFEHMMFNGAKKYGPGISTK